MKCPVCRSKETKVVDSRLAEEGVIVRRRRECVSCHYRFSTNETMELPDIMIVKNDGKREPYNRDKLEQGILRSLAKRSYTKDAFSRMIYAIERDIRKKKKREITSTDIGEIVMKHLQKFDKVAFIRFASIYRAFEDVTTFERELHSLQKKKRKKK